MVPKTMLAAEYPTSGADAGALAVAEIETPAPDRGEVLVAVRVSGVNPTDWKARDRLDGSAPYPFATPNQDGAGEIVAVGDGVDSLRIGERVWLYHARWQRRRGSAAQFIALPGEQAVVLPAAAGFDLGASLGIPYITAYHALHADGDIRGRQVLVHGGAGAVGHAAIELARFAGARVAATVSDEAKGTLAGAAGAELVVDYRAQDVGTAVGAWAPDGVVRIVDVNLPANLATDAKLIAPGGVIVGYASSGETIVPAGDLMARNALMRFVLVYTTPVAAQQAAIAGITAALEARALTPLPIHRFPLAEIADAHDAVAGGIVGKVLVDLP